MGAAQRLVRAASQALWLHAVVSGAGAEPLAPPDADVERIVITAERRAERLGRLPGSAVVATGAELDASGVLTSLDLPFRTPGLVFTQNTVLGQPYLRGVGSDIITAGADPSVAVFVDGAYQARPAAAFQDFYDVAQVEVLKGPQGTLFGRNATGGAIHILTREPGHGASAESDIRAGSFGALRVRSALNLPLLEDRAWLRIAGLVQRRDGFSRNLQSGRRVDDADDAAVRAKLAFEPAEGLRLRLAGDYSRERSSRGLAAKVVAPLGGSPAVAFGGRVPGDPRQVRFDSEPRASVEQAGTSLKADLEHQAFTLHSLSAWRSSRWHEGIDLDGTDLAFSTNRPAETSETFSQEFELESSADEPFEWLAGLFYLHERAATLLDVDVPPLAFRDRPQARHRTDAVGVFGELGRHFGDRWHAALGLRYSYERKQQRFVEQVNGAVAAAFRQASSWDDWSPRFVLDFAPVENTLVYASATRGFKSGGFNSSVAQPFPFDQETLWAVEVGGRAALCDGLVRLHGAFFYYDYDDIQLQVQSNAMIPFPRVENAGEARVLGVEGSLTLGPVRGAQIEGAFTYLHTRFDELIAVDPNDPSANPDQSGNRLPNAPSFSAWLAAQYALPLGGHGTLTVRSEYRYQSAAFFSIWEDPFVRQRAYGLWNLRLAYRTAGDHIELAVYGANLGDRTCCRSSVRVDGQIGNLATFGPPRTVGGEVHVRF